MSEPSHLLSGSYLHGNENNANQSGGTTARARSSRQRMACRVHARQSAGTYRISKHAEIFARVVNVLNVNYATGGFLTSNSFNPNGTLRTNPNDWSNENAVSPARRADLAGVRVRF